MASSLWRRVAAHVCEVLALFVTFALFAAPSSLVHSTLRTIFDTVSDKVCQRKDLAEGY